jgi:inorganic triphosphatase YgiF
MPRELELKLEVAEQDVESLRTHPLLSGAVSRTQPQLSVYFDTRRSKLRKAGYTLRVRRTSDGCIQTVKAAAEGAGLFDRDEWEAPVNGMLPDLSAAADTPLGPLLGPQAGRKLVPVLRSEVERTAWLLDHEGSTLEVTLDQGSIQSGAEERPLLEIEIELKKGHASAVIGLARQLGERVPLRLGVLTKAERGFALMNGKLAEPAKAGPVHVDPSMTVAEGFTATVHSGLRHFRLNEPLLAADRHPVALHQARVAMRRLRSSLSLFRPAIGDEAFPALREELRWFTAQLGDARNLDVFLGKAESQLPERGRLEAAREQAYSAIIETLASRRFRDLLLNLVAWVETGAWRESKKASQPLPLFAARRINRLWASIEAAGSQLTELEEEPRHRLRIEIKKLRYALEFVSALHRSAGRRRAKFMGALEALQEDLGHLNDLATARLLASEYQVERASVDGEAPQQVHDEEGRYLAAAEANFRRLEGVGAFWIRTPR